MPEDNPAQPLLDIRNKLGDWSRKILSYDKPVAQKAQTMNWKPEPNDEQKAEIKKEQQKPVARKKMPRKR